MKKIVSLILAAAMLLACSVCFAEGETVMHVGTNPEFSPFEYVDDNGEIKHNRLPLNMDVFIANARNPHKGTATHG